MENKEEVKEEVIEEKNKKRNPVAEALWRSVKGVKETKKGNLKHLIKTAIVLVVFLIVTNPSILKFLPEGARDFLFRAWSNIFGDVSSVASTIRINWIALFQIVAVILLLTILQDAVRIILNKIKPKTSKGKSLQSLLNSYCTYGFATVGIIWCMSIIGINLSTIFATIGIAALIVGFATESLIEDIITGLFLTFEDAFNVGDIIEYNGFRGTVTSIGVRVTCIQNASGNIQIVNNSDLRNILNRSKASSIAVCDIPVSYAVKLTQAEEVVNNILKTMPEKYPEVFVKTPEYAGVQALADSSVLLRVTAEVKEEDIFKATRLINREMKLGLDEAGIEIPFQQIVVHQE